MHGFGAQRIGHQAPHAVVGETAHQVNPSPAPGEADGEIRTLAAGQRLDRCGDIRPGPHRLRRRDGHIQQRITQHDNLGSVIRHRGRLAVNPSRVVCQ